MANMPVTTTTRNVLIKRLRHVIDTANSKTRRETVHVTKFSSDESDESDAKEAKKAKTARRATMVPSKASTPPRTMRASATPPRTTRASATPPPVQPKAITTRRNSGRLTPLADKEVATTKIAASSPIIEIDEDSDTEVIPLTQPVRKLREPSMGKSETVVTSFQHTVPSTPIVFEVYDDEDDNDSIGLESSNDVEVQTYTSGRSNFSAAYAKPLSTLGHRDFQAESQNIGRNSISTSYNTSYRQSGAYQRPTYASTSTFKSPSEHIEDEINDAPYLSDFTRRLTRLRAEPLTITPVNDEPAQSSYAYRPSGRKAAAKRDESLWRSFVTMLQTFNRQFGRFFFSVILVLVLILLFVIFFKND